MKNPYRLPDPGIQKTKKEIEKQVTLEEYYKAICELDELEEQYGLKEPPKEGKIKRPSVTFLTAVKKQKRSVSIKRSISGRLYFWAGPVATGSW